jgi:hypothetical protein
LYTGRSIFYFSRQTQLIKDLLMTFTGNNHA